MTYVASLWESGTLQVHFYVTSNKYVRKTSMIEVLYQAFISSFFPLKSAYDAEIGKDLVIAFYLMIFLEVTMPSAI